MAKISELFDFVFNRCPSCGLSATTFCARCWYVLNGVGNSASRPRGLYVHARKPFVQRGLYIWDDRDERQAVILRDAILASKEKPSPALMRLWASEFHRRAMFDGLHASLRDWVVLSPPGRRHSMSDDHAAVLANEVARTSGGRFRWEHTILEHGSLEARKKSTAISQKLKTRFERSEIEFRVVKSARRRLERVPGYIFIDDVLATGATAQAAWRALGRPRAFECWAVALRTIEKMDSLSQVEP